MKHAPTIAGALLGLMFFVFSLAFFVPIFPMPPGPPEGSPPALFMGALYPTGYLAFVKVLEMIGAVFVAVPKTRNIGLLILGPIIVNILAYHIFLTDRAGLRDPVLIGICALAAFLLWSERRAFAGLVKR